jgi:hypothetical protein
MLCGWKFKAQSSLNQPKKNFKILKKILKKKEEEEEEEEIKRHIPVMGLTLHFFTSSSSTHPLLLILSLDRSVLVSYNPILKQL